MYNIPTCPPFRANSVINHFPAPHLSGSSSELDIPTQNYAKGTPRLCPLDLYSSGVLCPESIPWTGTAPAGSRMNNWQVPVAYWLPAGLSAQVVITAIPS